MVARWRCGGLVLGGLILACAPVLAQGASTPTITGSDRESGSSSPARVEVGVGTTDEVTTGTSGPDAGGGPAAGAGRNIGPGDCARLADAAAQRHCQQQQGG